MARISSEDKAGLYITVIVHLAVIIILLLTGVGAVLRKDNSFVIDFTREEAIEQRQKEEAEKLAQEAFDDAIARRLDQMLSGNAASFRNVAVDRGALKDDRGTDADKLYEDAARLAKELKGGFTPDEPDDSYVSVTKTQKDKDQGQKSYSGPSVVSYTLDGRKASRLPIPAYRCYAGGMVTVIIKVDPQGNVVDAKVQEEASSQDKCLRDFAVRAARMSKFSASTKAPARQVGDIVYMFIAQ